MEENRELQIINVEDYAMSPAIIQKQVNIIQETMKQVMKTGEHYGTIPGCGDKPTLLKPGAEKICTTFRLCPTYEIHRNDLDNGHREYEIVCTLTHIPSSQIIAQGVGLCSSMESKYRWRKAELICPQCKKNAIIKGKKEFGGGWLCWAKKDGCGVKFLDGDMKIEGQEQGKIENEDIADIFNTVLKIGKKRAHVDAVLTATAASDIFTQDIEDVPVRSTDKITIPEPPRISQAPSQEIPPPKPMIDGYKEMTSRADSEVKWEQIGEWLKKHKAEPKLINRYAKEFALWKQAIRESENLDNDFMKGVNNGN